METTRKLGMNDNNNSTIGNGATTEPIKTNGQLPNGLSPATTTTMSAAPAKPSRYMLHGKVPSTTDAVSIKLSPPPLPTPSATQNGSVAPVVDKAEVFENDEIEFLLEEIRDLEIPACRTDSEREDFEIAGSRADLDLSLHLDSPVDTSWYSHAYYRQYMNQRPSAPWGVPLHCDLRPVKTPMGIIRILLVISSAACILCEFSAGTVQVGLFFLPLIGRLRLMVFCAIFSLLLTSLMIFLDISHIALMFPFNWPKLNAYLYFIISVIFIVGSSLLIHMVFFAHEYMWVPRHSKDTLFLSAMLGYTCSTEALVLSIMGFCPARRYRQVPADECDCIIDEGRELTPMSSTHKSLANSNSNFHIEDDIITDRR